MPQLDSAIGNYARFDMRLNKVELFSIIGLNYFTSKKIAKKIQVKPLGGLPINISYIETGWGGDFEVWCAGNALDLYSQTLEKTYRKKKEPLFGEILQIISEIDGTISTYHYSRVLLYFEDVIEIDEKNAIRKINFTASSRLKIS